MTASSRVTPTQGKGEGEGESEGEGEGEGEGESWGECWGKGESCHLAPTERR